MIDKDFERSLSAAFPLVDPFATLEAKVDRALFLAQRRKQVRVRVVWGTVATAAIAFAIVAFPSAQAYADVARIAGAMDGVSTVRIQKYSIDESGMRMESGFVLYDHGRWKMQDMGRLVYMLGGRQYGYEPSLKAFVVHESDARHAMKSMRVSDVIASTMGETWNRQAQVESVDWRGTPTTKITLKNGSLPERYVFFVDPNTQLPREVDVESLELGKWRLRQVMELTYDQKIAANEFSLGSSNVPVITQQEADGRIVSALTKPNLGELPLKKGRVVLRQFDVSADGTVFLGYQSGDSRANSWSGYGLRLRDSQGTVYTRREVFGRRDEGFISQSKDGRLEVEVLVPAEPSPLTTPRTYTVEIRTNAEGALARQLKMVAVAPDGGRTTKWVENNAMVFQKGSWMPTNISDPVSLCRRVVSGPTCSVTPSWATLAAGDFNNDYATGITESQTRAGYYFENRKWQDSIRWNQEALRYMRAHERAGYGPYAQNGPMEQIQKAQAEIAKQQRP